MNEKIPCFFFRSFREKTQRSFAASNWRKALLCFGFLLTLFSNEAQAQFSLSTGGSSSLVTCDSVQQTLTITKTSPFAATDQLVIALDLLDSVNLILPSLSVPDASVSVTNDVLTISGIDTVSQFTISYWVQANCDYIIQQSGILSYEQNISVNINGSTILNSTKTYTITPSILVYRGGTNLNITNARIGQVIERTYVYKNTSSQAPFTGVLQFTDTLFAAYAEAGLRFDTVYVASPNGTELSHLVTDTSATLTVYVDNLVQSSDSLVIKEIVVLTDCPNSSFDNSQTLVTAYYGCTASDICRKVSVPNEFGNIIFAKIDPNHRPIVSIKTKYEIGDCYSDDLRKSFKFTNIGSDTASNTVLYINQVQAGSLYNLSSVDTSTIDVTFFNGSAYQSLPYTITAPLYNSSLQRIWTLDLNRKLSPGDSVILSFDINQKCIAPSLYDSIAKYQ